MATDRTPTKADSPAQVDGVLADAVDNPEEGEDDGDEDDEGDSEV